MTDFEKYFCPSAQLLSLELLKIFALFLVRTSSGMLDEKISAVTMLHYIANTISAVYRSTGTKQFDRDVGNRYLLISDLLRRREKCLTSYG
jgi:hypothetical protein